VVISVKASSVGIGGGQLSPKNIRMSVALTSIGAVVPK
jgi:hypothetical protein